MHPLFLVPSTSTTAAATDSAKTDEQCYPLPQPPPSSSPCASSQRKLPSSQYKGVVPQPNGRWGAQIYEKHRRVWLGTFNSEAEAARAYDVAAQRFRGREATTNFAALPPHSPELLFLLSLTKADLIDMLRKHTYLDELHHRLRSRRNNDGSSSSNVLTAVTTRDLLFEKVVTPSDVGKLNRLVIPKQHAERHFPAPMEVGGDVSGILLSLEDGRGKVWRFRYSYWNSSQSYVLTRGWNRYVKEMGLRPGDVVMFHRAIGGDGQLYIDWRVGDGNSGRDGYDRGLDSMPSSSGSRGVRLFGVNIGYGGV